MQECARSVVLSLIFMTLASGCGGPKNTFVRDKTTKVTGVVLIDGKPEPMVGVRLNREGGPDGSAGTSKMLTPSGMTDEEGKFAIGTYDKGPEGDGAPDGTYTLTFQWGQINMLGGRYEGDKFNGKYADPAKSEFKVEVAGDAVDLGVIELATSSDGNAAKEKTPTSLGGDKETTPTKSSGSTTRRKKDKD